MAALRENDLRGDIRKKDIKANDWAKKNTGELGKRLAERPTTTIQLFEELRKSRCRSRVRPTLKRSSTVSAMSKGRSDARCATSYGTSKAHVNDFLGLAHIVLEAARWRGAQEAWLGSQGHKDVHSIKKKKCTIHHRSTIAVLQAAWEWT